jgi:hypothetical protein
MWTGHSSEQPFGLRLLCLLANWRGFVSHPLPLRREMQPGLAITIPLRSRGL